MIACRVVRGAILRREAVTPELERHLFSCHACRSLARAERVMDQLEGYREPQVKVPPGFVERVMRGLPKVLDRGSRVAAAESLLRWAAALLLFSLAAGYGLAAAERGAQDTEQVAGSALGGSAETSLPSFDF
jgi:hypothetical protein